jgi:hypothetical protein
MNGGGPTPRIALSKDRDSVASGLLIEITQRILPNKGVGDMDIDVRPRSEWRQGLPSGIRQLDHTDLIGQKAFVDYSNRQFIEHRH